MAAAKHLVTIKGFKDGLVFICDDHCPLADLLHELQYKLEHTHQKFLYGPLVRVNVQLGKRQVTEAEKEKIRAIIKCRGNLLLQSIESASPIENPFQAPDHAIKIIYGVIRSGQVIRHEGAIMLMGDVNPGGVISSTGDIYIMGSLRGMAHAGLEGNEQAIIAASHMRPTQLRIAEIISRPPDEWGIAEAIMEYAYISNGVMEINKINQLSKR